MPDTKQSYDVLNGDDMFHLATVTEKEAKGYKKRWATAVTKNPHTVFPHGICVEVWINLSEYEEAAEKIPDMVRHPKKKCHCQSKKTKAK